MPERKKLTKREELRAQRRRQQTTTRLIVFGIIGGVVLLFIAVAVVPSLIPASVGPITQITPVERPNADGTAAGDPNAPVKIDVYEDFQCPACANYSTDVEPQVMDAYVATGQAYYVYHHYPFIDDFSAAKESDQAANASMCAAEQGRFWDYHDMLFANWNGENQGSFNDKRLTAFAENLGLDMNQFNTCFKDNTYRDQIQADIASATQLKINGTPSIYVNGTQVTPDHVPSFEDMQAAIEAALGN